VTIDIISLTVVVDLGNGRWLSRRVAWPTPTNVHSFE